MHHGGFEWVGLLPLQLLVPEWPVVAPQDDRCCSLVTLEAFLRHVPSRHHAEYELHWQRLQLIEVLEMLLSQRAAGHLRCFLLDCH